jgi:hypothetical protein
VETVPPVEVEEEYRLVKWKFEEVENERTIYTSDEDCSVVVLNNPSVEEVWMPTSEIFKDVIETSTFESNDSEAFAWIPEDGAEVPVPELMINGAIWWWGNCAYKEGTATIPYIDDISKGDKILMRPYSTLYLSGEITYCRRVCNYTITLQGEKTGIRHEVQGVWTQIVPISKHTTSSDKRP